ncbi:hypothetical protein B7P43_G02298 [Cryptotermes secundus]|uniref:Uncharacterized protein n=1 Tax=Cryptotermes secundus TaxID=105785 RepID=A0A2J7RQI9_9NEOP|nr:hypothetical protein B7P43_G02298 [Cryptotermes secundus]
MFSKDLHTNITLAFNVSLCRLNRSSQPPRIRFIITGGLYESSSPSLLALEPCVGLGLLHLYWR